MPYLAEHGLIDCRAPFDALVQQIMRWLPGPIRRSPAGVDGSLAEMAARTDAHGVAMAWHMAAYAMARPRIADLDEELEHFRGALGARATLRELADTYGVYIKEHSADASYELVFPPIIHDNAAPTLLGLPLALTSQYGEVLRDLRHSLHANEPSTVRERARELGRRQST